MRTGIAIMLFVAVAGFHNAISASLEFDESNKSPEERMYEENVTTTQPDDSEYAAAHVNVTEDLLKTTHMDGETEALTFDTGKGNYFFRTFFPGKIYIHDRLDDVLQAASKLL
ncbi:hypothetical protein F2P79_002161 [Pimephales promelas]|nr:hypothetical protein F2P79_002161 [Pimephales promelas]